MLKLAASLSVRESQRSKRLLVAGCFFLLVAGEPARSSMLSANVTETACVNGNASSNSEGCISNSASAGPSNAFSQGGVASSFASVYAGIFYGELFANIGVVRGDFNVGADGVTSISANAQVQEQFTDSITVSGPGMVQIVPSDRLSFTLGVYNTIDDSYHSGLQFYVDGQAVISGQPIFLVPGVHAIEGDFDASLSVGDSMSLPPPYPSGQTAPPYSASDNTQFNPVSNFYLDVITPGASVEAASGHYYGSNTLAAPEPAGSVLVCLGASLLLVIRNWRQAIASAIGMKRRSLASAAIFFRFV